MNFIDREEERAFLADAWEADGGQLLILYGRRRVGKTELLRVFGWGRRQIFYVAAESSTEVQLRSFAQAARDGLGEAAAGVSFADWEAALRFIAMQARRERLLVVLDEFPYLAQADASLLSVLQRAWDHDLKNTLIRVVLCGSSISFMQSETLSHRSPVFGRRTGQLRLDPLGYREAGLFFPDVAPPEKVELYATLGGMPAYLLQFRGGVGLWENIRRQILRKGAFLHDEVTFLLMQELREPRHYLAILAAMAEGRTRLGDIAQRALGHESSNRAAFYLQTLQDLHLVERRVPITEAAPRKSRKGMYAIADPFARFWLRFVYPETSALEAGAVDHVLTDRIRPAWSDFVAPVFENICRQFVRHPDRRGSLPFEPATVGSWWSASGEIDVVALDARRARMLCGECKWSSRPVGTNVLDDLLQRASVLNEEIGAKKVSCALFARRGFTDALLARARHEDVRLFTADDLYTNEAG